MNQEFEIPSGSPAAIPYKWEAAPGRPIVEAVPVVEPWMSPLRRPPGARKATKPLVSEFDGFEPEPPVLPETQLAGKILKKLNRLRGKSMVAATRLTSEASRVTEHSGESFPMEDRRSCYDDFDALSRCWVSTCHIPGAPRYSTSVDSSFSEPFRTSNTRFAVPSSPCTTSPRPSSYCRFEDGDCLGEGNAPDDDKALPGPSESAWHQPHDDEVPTCVSQKWQMQRSYSNLIPTILRQSTSSRSFKHLILAHTFRKSKTAKRLDFET